MGTAPVRKNNVMSLKIRWERVQPSQKWTVLGKGCATMARVLLLFGRSVSRRRRVREGKGLRVARMPRGTRTQIADGGKAGSSGSRSRPKTHANWIGSGPLPKSGALCRGSFWLAPSCSDHLESPTAARVLSIDIIGVTASKLSLNY